MSEAYVKMRLSPYQGHLLMVNALVRHTDDGDHVLEGGCSTGYVAELVTARGRRVDGVEVDPDAAKEAERVCERVIVADLEQLDTSQLRDEYDALLFGDTLEHLRDPAELLRRLRPHLADDGVVVAGIPNVANWSMRLRLLFGRFNYTDRGLLDRTHLRFFTRSTAIELFTGTGFDVVELHASVPLPLTTAKPLTWLAYKIGSLWPELFAYTFIVVARPRATTT